MTDFSFAITSYNQEEYIIQLLESIKYQIEQYGSDKNVQLVLGDDRSKDRTVLFAKKWLGQNTGLFSDVTVIERPENVGTIKNMKEVSEACLSPRNLIIAGDDLIYRNDLLGAVGEKDVILTPSIEFDDQGNIDPDIKRVFIELLMYKNDPHLRSRIGKMLKYNQCISSPGVLLSLDVWGDPEFLEMVKPFRNIEDICEWEYIFNRYQREFTLEIESKPYVMYRTNSGVSEQLGRKKANVIELEFKEIRKVIPCKEDAFPKYVNPYRYLHFLKTHLVYGRWRKMPLVEAELQNWAENVSGAEDYLQLIKDRADAFYNNI